MCACGTCMPQPCSLQLTSPSPHIRTGSFNHHGGGLAESSCECNTETQTHARAGTQHAAQHTANDCAGFPPAHNPTATALLPLTQPASPAASMGAAVTPCSPTRLLCNHRSRTSSCSCLAYLPAVLRPGPTSGTQAWPQPHNAQKVPRQLPPRIASTHALSHVPARPR